MINNLFIGLFLILCSVTDNTFAEFNIVMKGSALAENKTSSVKEYISLLHILDSVKNSTEVFWFGVSWQDESLKEEQAILQRELLQNLTVLVKNAKSTVSLEYFKQLERLIKKQQVTGRIINIDFDRFHVAKLPLKNKIISTGSTFNFPLRPKIVNLIGFQRSNIEFDSEKNIEEIVSHYPICAECQPGLLWLVHPNSLIEKIKVGLWTNELRYPTPGAWLIAILDDQYFDGVSPGFYKKLTKWLSLQVIL